MKNILDILLVVALTVLVLYDRPPTKTYVFMAVEEVNGGKVTGKYSIFTAVPASDPQICWDTAISKFKDQEDTPNGRTLIVTQFNTFNR